MLLGLEITRIIPYNRDVPSCFSNLQGRGAPASRPLMIDGVLVSVFYLFSARPIEGPVPPKRAPPPLCPVTPGRPDFFMAVYAVVAPASRRTGGHLWSVAFLAGPARPAASWAAPWPGTGGPALSSSPVPGWGLSPADVFGGTGIQRLLLEGEGVPFLPDGRVDLSRCLWDGGEERSTL